MSRLDELIKEYCSDGIEYVKIGDVVNYEQPSKYIVSSTDYDDNYDTPVLTAGQTFILGYTNETNNIYEASKDEPVIIFDDFTGAFKWVDFPFKVKSSAMKILTAKKDKTTLRYIFHIMGYLNFTSDEHKRLWISVYSEINIPLPPLEVQREIVKVLDNFTLLTAELTAELTARRKQYEYYRDKLLSFDVHGGGAGEVEWRTLGELCIISSGGDVPKESFSEIPTDIFNIPIISNGIGANAFYGYTNVAKISEPAVTITARGTIGYAEYRDYPYYPIIRLLSLAPKNQSYLNTKYLYYVMQKQKYNIPKTGIPQLTSPMIQKISIPVPSISIQEKIVSVLDNFDAICSDLSIGLPAEIEARQKQYEYYRDKLFGFKEL